MKKMGYKVLMKYYDGTFRSSHIGGLRYKISRWTTPRSGYGPLCVFTNRKDARLFVKSSYPNDFAIFRCVYEPSTAQNVWSPFASTPLTRLPNGKALATRVKITERVR